MVLLRKVSEGVITLGKKGFALGTKPYPYIAFSSN